jgi:hypothetical protein
MKKHAIKLLKCMHLKNVENKYLVLKLDGHSKSNF